MTIHQERIAHALEIIAREEILDFANIHRHPYGAIELQGIKISSDKSYVDLIVVAQKDDKKTLSHFLSPLAAQIRSRMAHEIFSKKVPQVRFREGKNTEGTQKDVLELIHELDKKYGLSQ